MNKIIIPSILTATILIAGMFALMPVDKASTVHTTIISNRLVQTTYGLSGVTAASIVVVVDTTPLAMGTAHIAAVLPVAEAGVANDCETEAPLITVQAGNAATALTTVIAGAHNTGITARTNIGAPFGATDDLCVFHRTITVADTPGAGTLTDIVVIGAVGALPADASITVTANVL